MNWSGSVINTFTCFDILVSCVLNRTSHTPTQTPLIHVHHVQLPDKSQVINNYYLSTFQNKKNSVTLIRNIQITCYVFII